MPREEFEKLVRSAILTLPKEFRDILDNVAVTIEDDPTPLQLGKLHVQGNMMLFGLYEGVPKTRRGSNYSMVLPDKITIFQGPIERFGWNEEQIARHVRDVVLHEIGHHFGLSDLEIRKAGK